MKTQKQIQEVVEEPYYKTDHYHCWTEKKPPCGQKVEHFKCCLCEELNPKITSLVDSVREDYNELIMAVANKNKGETRHATALRYIKNAEQPNGQAQESPKITPTK
jgi:hypothetical protein